MSVVVEKLASRIVSAAADQDLGDLKADLESGDDWDSISFAASQRNSRMLGLLQRVDAVSTDIVERGLDASALDAHEFFQRAHVPENYPMIEALVEGPNQLVAARLERLAGEPYPRRRDFRISVGVDVMELAVLAEEKQKSDSKE